MDSSSNTLPTPTPSLERVTLRAVKDACERLARLADDLLAGQCRLDEDDFVDLVTLGGDVRLTSNLVTAMAGCDPRARETQGVAA